jgi:hypothetical protein
MDAAREEARQKALEGIKSAGEKDWRALAEWLKLTFPEHRSGYNINVSATAGAAVQVTDVERAKLIAMRERALSHGPTVTVTVEPSEGAPAPAGELGKG